MSPLTFATGRPPVPFTAVPEDEKVLNGFIAPARLIEVEIGEEDVCAGREPLAPDCTKAGGGGRFILPGCAMGLVETAVAMGSAGSELPPTGY